MNIDNSVTITDNLIAHSFKRFSITTEEGRYRGFHILSLGKEGDSFKQYIFNMVYPISLSAFSAEDSEEMQKDVWNHIMSSDHFICILDSNSKCVAFRVWNCITYEKYGIIYLAGMCIHKDYQKKKIGSQLLQYVCTYHSRYRYIALRTQNPVMKYCFDQALAAKSYPLKNGGVVPEDIKKVAELLAINLDDKNLNIKTLVSAGVYGSSLYTTPYHTQNKEYEELFSGINIQQGDAIYCICRRF